MSLGASVSTLAGGGSTYSGQSSYQGYGNGVGTNAEFFGPIGMAQDSNNVLYIADSNNNLIRAISGSVWLQFIIILLKFTVVDVVIIIVEFGIVVVDIFFVVNP